jgi:tetratricopeptide (TPR) repeat protein
MIDRNFDGAEAALQNFPFATLSSVAGAPVPKSYLEGCIRVARGDNEAAQKLFEAARPSVEAETLTHSSDPRRHAILGLLYAFMGKKAEALREGEQAVRLEPLSSDHYNGPQRLCNLALIHARIGDNDQAIAMIKHLLTEPGCVSFYQGSISLSDLRLRWQWDPLRKDPRFQALLAEPEPTTVY